jgi:hypothetical protein
LERKKKEWEAELLAKKRADEEARKKKKQEIEQAVRDRMAEAGCNNEDIEKVVEGKEVHYCHEHHQPHPCRICISKTTVDMSVGLQGSCILFCILTPNYDRLAHRRLFSLTRLLFSYLSLTRALFSLLRIHLRILGSLSLGNYRSRAP